jgi:DNA repair photolyase
MTPVAASAPKSPRDSASQIGQVVEHTSSWLTINPFKGCSLGCAYCFRARWHPADTPTQQQPVHDAIAALVAHPSFVAHETPVSVNISSTDALLPEVRKSTFDALRLLEERQLRNPVGITTKLAFTSEEVSCLQSLRYPRPIVFISLAFIPRSIEPIGITHRVKTMAALSRVGVRTVLYFRPIVAGWNDSDRVISRALEIGATRAHAICIGSLRSSPEIRRSLSAVGVESSHLPAEFHNKTLPAPFLERVLEMRERLRLTVPLFKHTSCAVSFLLAIPNYNQLFTDPIRHCLPSCPLKQQHLCNGVVQP